MNRSVIISWPKKLASRIRKAAYPLAAIYLIVVAIRLWLHARGFLKVRRISCPVISVGNLTVGGTGKSECVAMLASILSERSVKAAVISRGYKGRASGIVNVLSDGQDILMGPDEAGDEPCMLAERLSGVPILIGRDKAAACELALEKFSAEALLLDDGYQHLRLWRDLNLLLVDASDPLGNGLLLPAGQLREPPSGARRADAIILTRWGERDEAKVKQFMRRCSPGTPFFKASYEPLGVERAGPGGDLDLVSLAGRKILAFCGIAKPSSFLGLANKLGCQIVGHKIYPDHYSYGRRDLDRLLGMARRSAAELCLTTTKDIVKVKRLAAEGEPFFALRVGFKLLEGETKFSAMLMGAIKGGRAAPPQPA